MAMIDSVRTVGVRTLAWVKAHPKTVGTAFTLWLGSWLLMWLLVPGWLQPKIEQGLSEQLGRAVRIQSLQFRPWSLELVVNGLSISSSDGKSNQLHIARVVANAELSSVLRMAPVVGALDIEEPQIVLTRLSNGSYDVDDLIKKFSAPTAQSTDEPLHYALYNLNIRGGTIDFDDRPVGKRHRVRELQLSLPFLSNLPSKHEVKVQPHLSLLLNGERIDTAAQATPFADHKQALISLKLPHWDIAPYLNYWPTQLPIAPTQGRLALDLSLGFEQNAASQSGAQQLAINGRVQLDQWKWSAKALASGKGADATWLAWDRLGLQLKEVKPWSQQLQFSSIEWDGLQATAFKDASGRWLGWAQPVQSAAEAKAAKPTAPWTLGVEQFALKNAQLRYLPRASSLAGAVVVDRANLQAQHLAWPLAASHKAGASVQGNMQWPLLVSTAKSQSAGTVSFTASVGAQSGTAQLQIAAANLSDLKALSGLDLEPELAGLLVGQLSLSWAQGANGAYSVQVQSPSLALEQVTLKTRQLRPSARGGDFQGDNAKPLVSGVKRLELQGLQAQWPQNQINVAKVLIDAPQIEVNRDAHGQWMWTQWLGQGRATTTRAAADAPTKPVQTPAPTAQTKAPAPAWQVQVAEVALQSGRLLWWDAAASGVLASRTTSASTTSVASSEPAIITRTFERATARLDVTGLDVRIKSLNLSDQGLASGKSPFEVKAQLQSMGRNASPRKGSLQLTGALQAQAGEKASSLSVDSNLRVSRFPLHAVEPYARAHVFITLLQADASLKGRLQYKQTGLGGQSSQLQFLADVSLDDMQANSLDPVQELLSWKTLELKALRVSTQTGQATQVSVGKTRLADFYARLIISDKGQINLQHLVRPSIAPETTSSSTAAPAQIRFGGIELVNGRINFSDFFIHPNYTANLSELNGSLGAFSTAVDPSQVQMADLLVRGKAQGTADLNITGQLNPLAKPLAMNIKGKVSDLELPPLSPYTAKYLGYAIERGKMNVDVGYEIAPDGQLKASNNFNLNQLTLGEKIEGQGTSLPVKLAISLLKDRNGVIDVNLPVAGSVNDPQFSVGPIVWRLILSMIGRAITSPFSLIAGAFSGGGDPGQASVIAFAPGSDRMQAGSAERMGALVKAMTERPALKMSLVGQVNAKTEGQALQRDKLQQLVWAEKQRRAGLEVGKGERGQITGDEYPALLKEVYRQSNVKKPRNLIGMAKDISVPEMESLLMAQFAVNEDAMRELGFARAQQVKNALVAGGLALERVFLGNPKLDAETPHVQLQVAVD